jgi:hypothetical protein
MTIPPLPPSSFPWPEQRCGKWTRLNHAAPISETSSTIRWKEYGCLNDFGVKHIQLPPLANYQLWHLHE